MKKTIFISIGMLVSYLLGAQTNFTVPNLFTSGTVISASQMNDNFSAIENQINSIWSAVNSLSGGSSSAGIIISLSGTKTISCNSDSNVYIDMNYDVNFNSSTAYAGGVITIPATGYYSITAYTEQDLGMGFYQRCLRNGTALPSFPGLDNNRGAYTYKLDAGDTILCQHRCNIGDGPQSNITSESFVSIFPL